ncbi:unnamed protein product [Nyctereutes procyonoides]|uniref:(raccoon dog) hypothetical protein n=1 Tax=Nyctereutes procyonoides TaxID=34880 RepID=A0A811YRN3_NYCPR|nr:unnamed protein product [Nyctereutes procyonoides]
MAAGTALPGEQPGGGRLAPEGTAPRSSGAAAAGQRGHTAVSAPLAAGGPLCSGAAPSPPTRRARAGQSGRRQEAELPGRSVRRESGLPGAPLGREWRAGAGSLSRRLSPLASGPTPAAVGLGFQPGRDVAPRCRVSACGPPRGRVRSPPRRDSVGLPADPPEPPRPERHLRAVWATTARSPRLPGARGLLGARCPGSPRRTGLVMCVRLSESRPKAGHVRAE